MSFVSRKPSIVYALVATAMITGCARFEEEESDEDARDEAYQSTQVTPVGGTPNGDARDSSATLLFDVASNEVVSEGLTVLRFRAFQTNPPNFSPGDLDKTDSVVFDVWYEIEGVGVTSYVRFDNGGKGYAVDADGWLFDRARPAGTLVTESGNAALGTGVNRAFRVTSPDLLLDRDYILAAPSSLPAIVSSSASFPWVGRVDRAGPELARHRSYRANHYLAEVVPMGCLVYSPNSGGAQALFAQIDAGVLATSPSMRFPDGTVVATVTDRGLDETVVTEELQWMLSGVNVKTQTLRIVVKTGVGAWQGRQLPTPEGLGSTNAPRLSRLEEVFRTCHSAASAAPGYFNIIYQGSDGQVASTLPIAYCDAYALSLGSGTAVPLDSYPAACNWGASVNFSIPGTWSGAAHGVQQGAPGGFAAFVDATVSTPVVVKVDL